MHVNTDKRRCCGWGKVLCLIGLGCDVRSTESVANTTATSMQRLYSKFLVFASCQWLLLLGLTGRVLPIPPIFLNSGNSVEAAHPTGFAEFHYYITQKFPQVMSWLLTPR